MKQSQYLLIGGGVASSQAAKILRMKDEDGTITLVCKEPLLPYDRPPLSKELLRGEKTADEIIFDNQSVLDEKRIDALQGDAVVALNATDKTARLVSGAQIAFDKAFIATGATPIPLDIPGATLDGVYYLRTMQDALSIASVATPGSHAVVIGAGFIGLEVAASLTFRGVHATVIEAEPRIWPRFADAAFASFVQTYCEERGVSFLTGERAAEFRGHGRVESVRTESGQEIPCSFACIGIGVRPDIDVARNAGLDIDDGIVVNEYLQTSHPDIYAGGDVASFPDPVFGRRRRVEHWGHAEYCGQLAGLNMTGAGQKYDLLTYVWSDIFDLHIEFAGDESHGDRTLTRATLGKPPFTVLHFEKNRLVAYFAVNTDSKEFPKLQRLIRRGVDLGGRDAELQDPTFELKTLL